MAERSQSQVWLKSAGQGDSLALSKLLASFHPVLRARVEARMSRAMRARLEPEDLLQDTYLEVFRQMDRFENRGPTSFFNWVVTILDSKLVDAWRAQHRQVRNIVRETSPRAEGETDSYWDLLDHLYADSGTPSHVFRRQEALGALVGCIVSLSEPHRRVIQLRFLEGLSVRDVADRLSKSEAAVVALTMRALEALRRSMDRLGEFTHGA